MFRFDAKKAFYFYPEVGDIEDKVLFLNSGSSYEKIVGARADVCLIKHGLHIPRNVTEYNSFIEAMKHSEKEFTEVFS